MIDYSVIIRTTGNAGEKYRKLLNSIMNLDDQPKEIIVVLPIGYALPKEKIGTETFYFCEKGMVRQRLYGIEKCKTKYALICDDDVSFDSDFVKKLHKPIIDGVSQISAGPLLSFLPQKGFESFCHAVTGAATPTIKHKERYITVLSTSGYAYNRNINTNIEKYMEAESLPWTCFYADINEIKKIRLEDETWLDAHGYAAMDDLTMFYKAKLLGIKTVIVTNALYEHLDARTSRNRSEVKKQVAYSLEFNRYIFWHRFIYSMDKGIKKYKDVLCIKYYYFMKKFYYLINICTKRMSFDTLKLKKKAIRDAKEYVNSDEYKKLSTVKK